MNLFYGTLTFTSAPVDTQDATVAKGYVTALNDRNVDTPVSIRAYGKTGTKMLNIKPKSRIQVNQGTLVRDKNYGYVINVYRYTYLPEQFDDMLFPDWHEIVLSGRTSSTFDKNNNRMYFKGDGYEVVKRSIAVNTSKDRAEFFDLSVFSSDDDRVRKTDIVKNYCAGKGVFMVVRGTFKTTKGSKTNEDGSKTLFTDISVSDFKLGPKTAHGDAPSSDGNGHSSNGYAPTSNGNGAKPQEYVAAPVPGSQPQMPDTDEDLPF
jgi:single-stranded DNA-binding protein